MTNKIKKYCEGLDCAICDEKEPCIYKIANDLQEQLSAKEQECEELKEILNEGCLHNLTLMTEQRVLLQTLTEIKTDILDIREGISYFWVIDKCDKILQKISECEVE